MNLFYYPFGNSPDNFDLPSVQERCSLYGGSWDRWQATTVNAIDHALAEIIYMNQKAESPARIVQSLWKAKDKALCLKCATWMHIEVRPMIPPFAQTFAVCPTCNTANPIRYPFAAVDYCE